MDIQPPEIEQDIKNLDYWLVGGAVRDLYLGKTPKDRDYVVTNTTEQEMEERGFTKIDASNFPVYQDSNGDEWALARKEISTGEGYTDFKTTTDNVTLKEDLLRRDFTINAIAYQPETEQWEYIVASEDNYAAHSIRDLDEGIIRHITDAFNEDPLRILRMARFAARYDFEIADHTMHKSQDNAHKINELPGERITEEIKKAMEQAKNPRKYWETLKESGALAEIMPKVDQYENVSAGPEKWHEEENMWEHAMMTVEEAQKIRPNTPDFLLMALLHDIGKVKSNKNPDHGIHPSSGLPIIRNMSKRLKFSNDLTQKLLDASKHHMRIHSTPMKAHDRMCEKKVLDLVKQLESSKGISLEELIDLAKADARGRKPTQEIYIEGIKKRINTAKEAIEKIDAEQVTSKRGKDIEDYSGEAISQMIIQDRVEYMKRHQEPVKKSVIDKIKEKVNSLF